MSKILVIAEKPSVARDIARVLHASGKGEGFLSGENYLVSWAIGHLITLKNPEEIDERYKKWRAEDLPILPEEIPLKVIRQTSSQFSVLKKLMNSTEVSSLICATDSGREGELIFRYIYQTAGCKKPVQRLWISSLTDEAIQTGFSELKPSSEYDALYRSARCRSEADWLIGMNASRAFTLRYDALLSIGRVQTPTLAILVKRRLEIDRFVPEPYWQVKADFRTHQGVWFDRETKDRVSRITSREKAEEIAGRVRGQKSVIKSIQSAEKKEPPPQLYDLTTLQREANAAYSFSASKTLKLAQSLYEKHKLITYPRTDSRYLSHDMMPSVKKALSAVPEELKQWAQPLLEQHLPMKKRVFDDSKLTDHHAIIPTGKAMKPDQLTTDEAKLYQMISRKLIAAFYPEYRYQSLTVITEAAGECFLTDGTRVLQAGFKALYPDKKADSPDLTALKEGDESTVRSAEIKEEKTKPPKEHTDASLLSAMEHAGREIEDEELREAMKSCSLGTPATRAAIIDRLLEVGYAERKGKIIRATEKGCRLLEVVPKEIASPEITGKWEQALEAIAAGEDRDERFMEGIRKMASFLTDYAKKDAPEAKFEREAAKGKGRKKSAAKSLGLPCPVCGKGKITENTRAFGCSEWKKGCGFTLWKNAVQASGGPELNEKIIRALFSDEKRRIRGSTGTLSYQDGKLVFEKK